MFALDEYGVEGGVEGSAEEVVGEAEEETGGVVGEGYWEWDAEAGEREGIDGAGGEVAG